MNIACWLSLSRGFLALFFLCDSHFWQTFAILAAAVSDFLDGYIARRFHQTTRLGTILDPVTDKLFVASAVLFFWHTHRVDIVELAILFSRDISLLLFTAYLFLVGSYKSWQIRSFVAGKLMTTFQFIALLFLAQGHIIPGWLLCILFIAGAASFCELIVLSKATSLLPKRVD